MAKDCLTQRADSLIAATSAERHQLLAERVLELSGQMNSRGIFHSSIHVNAVAKECAAELKEIVFIAWDCVRRAHDSCGSRESEKVLPYFLGVIDAEAAKAEAMFQGRVGSIAENLQNKSMLATSEVATAQELLVKKYKVEIEMYAAKLRHGLGSSLHDRWTHRFKNNPVLAFAAIVTGAVIFLVTFSDSLIKFLNSVKELFGNG